MRSRAAVVIAIKAAAEKAGIDIPKDTTISFAETPLVVEREAQAKSAKTARSRKKSIKADPQWENRARQYTAQITENYEVAKLVGRKVAAVVNFPPRQIGKFKSEVLTLGFPDAQGHVVLVSPDKDVPNGARLF